jgi:hypothetical protein
MANDVAKYAAPTTTGIMVLAVARKVRAGIPRDGLISIIVVWQVCEDKMGCSRDESVRLSGSL